MQNFDGSFILSHKHKIIPQKFTESFLNAIRTLSEIIKFFEQEMVRSGNDRILMQKRVMQHACHRKVRVGFRPETRAEQFVEGSAKTIDSLRKLQR
jgi:hypothetical protein